MNRERARIDFKPTKKLVMLTDRDSPMTDSQGPRSRESAAVSKSLGNCYLELRNASACQENFQPRLEGFTSFLDIRSGLVGGKRKNSDSSLFGNTLTLSNHSAV